MSAVPKRPRTEPVDDPEEDRGPIDGDTDLPEPDSDAMIADDEVPLGADVDDEIEDPLDVGGAWIDDASDAHDDDGDADELSDVGNESWLADEASGDETEDDDLDLTDETAGSADAEDGPDEDETHALEPETARDANDGDDDAPDDIDEAPSELPAFGLAPPAAVALDVFTHDAATTAACVSGARLVIVGDGVHRVDLELDRVAPTRFERVSDMVFSSIAALGDRSLVAATVAGRVLRSLDGGAHWEAMGSLAADDGADAGVHLVADSQLDTAPIWARAHGGGVFRSRDAGRTWDGPLLRRPVHCIAGDGRGGIVAAYDTRGELVVMDADGNATETHFSVAGTAECVAVHRDVWVACVRHRAVAVSADGGRTQREAAALECATAAALFETDDGAIQLAAAVYDDVTDRSTLVVGSVAADGTLRRLRRIADVSAAGDADDDADAQSRVTMIVPLDGAGRRLALVLARRVVIVRRDAADA